MARVVISLVLLAAIGLACNTPAREPAPCRSIADKNSIDDWSQYLAVPGTGSTVTATPLELRWPHSQQAVTSYELFINDTLNRETDSNCATIAVASSSFPVVWRVDGLIESTEGTERIQVGEWQFTADL